MKTIKFRDLELSQLMLGTVQFGMQYGMANKAGQPAYEEVRAMLEWAYEHGVNCLDTARAYGTSEEVIARALAELNLTQKFIVATKVQRTQQVLETSQEADAFVEKSVTDSLRTLKLETIPICLFHWENDFRYVESLLKLRDRGLVRHIGSSVMTREATQKIMEAGVAEALQIPTSIVDPGFIRAGIYAEAERRQIATFVRSIYMQGMVLMPEAEIPEKFADVIPLRRRLENLAAQAGMQMDELALRYILAITGVTCIVIGTETIEQVRHNIELFSRGPLDANLVEAVDAIVGEQPDFILRLIQPAASPATK